MTNSTSLRHKGRRAFFFLATLLISAQALLLPTRDSSQKIADPALEKMPADLERDYALSSLPPHLRKEATVYLLDPAKGYYITQQGTNGFICYIARTVWEWGEFRNDITMPISFDAEGARTIFPTDRDVAEMRASGKFSALQIKDSMIDRIRKGIYKAPSRPGVSFMLEPVMRGYMSRTPDHNEVMSMVMPHYMFYAPYMNDSDIGGSPDESPFVNNPENNVLGEKKGPYGFIILPAGKVEAAQIIESDSALLRRLAEYKPYYKTGPSGM
jgi:hypothetical protein